MEEIIIKGARENNLKNINLSIPKNKLIAVTGLSGSGKSSLAYDTLQKECMRQYMESLGMVTDFLSKPKVDEIVGLSPSISVDQRLLNHNPRSTVGTLTEVYTYLRVLYARIGERRCPYCGMMFKPMGDAADSQADLSFDDEASGEDYTVICPHCQKATPQITMAHFSFNKPEGACPTCTGLGDVYEANLKLLVDESKSIQDGGILSWDWHWIKYYRDVFAAAEKLYGISLDFTVPIEQFDQRAKDYIYFGVESPRFKRYFPHIEAPRNASDGRFEGLATNLLRRHAQRADDAGYREKLEKLMIHHKCPDCGGTRLKKESREVLISGRSIVELSELSFEALLDFLEDLQKDLSSDEQLIAEPILADLRDRIRRLLDAGVGYLSMNREASTLSGGEAQRLRLASLLGSGLTGVLYCLDEPTTGLHPRDTQRLIAVLKKLRDLGNTVLVIEHDLDVIRNADHIIDIGPGAGKEGGRVVAQGTVAEIMANEQSLTGKALRGLSLPSVRKAIKPGPALKVWGARAHNLKNVNVSLPLGVFGVISGVSGSGKSSLMFDILDRAGRMHFYGANEEPGDHDRIEGWEYIDKLVTVDQSQIGRITRSNVATYTDVFTPIRTLFAELPQSRAKGLSARHYSFNVPGGRCERCEGTGILTINMHFLPDVQVTCPSCKGRRFKKDILEVKYKGLNISNILDMTVKEAAEVLSDVKGAGSKLKLLKEVGLDYLSLGQVTTTLSGGEAQRIKLSKELGRSSKGHTLYLLDEPTVGLHPGDTQRLIRLFRHLVEMGNTVYVVEHNIDVIKQADYVLDMGPEGGDRGGLVLAQGTPEDIAACEASHTGRFLRMS